MKAQITTAAPKLAPGQLWRNTASGNVYLAVHTGDGITLVNTKAFDSTWARTSGFGGDDLGFEYVGNLEITK